jgi:hypothetical protein
MVVLSIMYFVGGMTVAAEFDCAWGVFMLQDFGRASSPLSPFAERKATMILFQNDCAPQRPSPSRWR